MIADLPAEERHRYEERIALGRFGTPAEVTGAIFNVDGGL
jgi:hypothetical protein